MNSSKKLVVLLLTVLFFIGCKKNTEEANEGITITPVDNYFEKQPGNIINFTVKFESRKELVKYRITETIDNSNSTTIKEENISGKNYLDWFDYTVPQFEDYGTHDIKLVFSAFDIDGNSMNRAKVIYVNIEERILAEYSGNNMYSSLTNQFNAYDLLTSTPKYSSDSTSHIIDLSVTNPNDTLSRSWASPYGIKFVKHNSFDYGNATDLTVQNAYNSGIKNDTLRNLATDDVILTKINDSYVALKLIYVIDDPGKTNDKYIFSIKR
ncbi:MAG: hypothetical protein H6587_00485 [Flavobacteriales bacterium]|nr:hypothetical protein [Flavobacteriales bacterium]